jgi:O-succinylbenzoic acid--CoA ligase
VLRAHPDVADCAVVGMPSMEWGQTVAAVIVTRAPMTAEALDAHCRARLAGYKVPRAYRFVDALPLNAAGKVDRARAVEMLNVG